jgi:hypothetical protein
MGFEGSFLGDRMARDEADNECPQSAEIKKTWCPASTPIYFS